MKKNSFFFIKFTIFLLLISNSFPIFAESKGFDECRQLKVFLQKNDIPIEELPVTFSYAKDFPFNIKVEVNHSQKKSHDVYFVFSIKEALENREFVINLLDYFLNSYYPEINVNFAFTYGGKPDFYRNTTVSGTEALVSYLDETENISAFCVSFDSQINSVVFGNGKKCSPSWIQKLATSALFENKIFYVIEGGFINPLYRFYFLKENFNAGIFLENNIPAIGLKFDGSKIADDYEKRLINFFSSLILNFEDEYTDEWEIHNQIFTIGNYAVNIPERFTLVLLIIFTAASIFLICEFSFFLRRTKKNYARKISKMWFILPLSSFLTMLTFAVGQMISALYNSIFKTDFYTLLAIKAFIGFGLLTIVHLILIKSNKVEKNPVYSYLLMISSIFNIFLFSAIDLSLFYLFAIEYLIIYLSRVSRRLIFLAVIFLVMCVPFVPYVVLLIFYIEPASATKLVFCSMKYNLLISIAFQPFLFEWIRIIVRLNEVWNKVDVRKKRFIKQNVIAICSSVAIFAGIMLAVAKFIPEKYKQKEKIIKVRQFQSQNDDLIAVEFSESEYFGSKQRILRVKTKEPVKNLQLGVSCENSEPVSFSEFSYVSNSENKTVFFNLPEWPPAEFEITYIPGSDEKTTVCVKAIYPDSDDDEYSKIEVVRNFELLSAKETEE